MVEKAKALPPEEAEKLLGDFTCEMTERSNDLLRELLACLDTVDAEVHPQELSITDPDATGEAPQG